MNTYKLEIRSVSRELDYEGFQDVARLVRYTLHGHNERKVRVSCEGEITLPPPKNKENYITYFELTREQVESWTWSLLKNSKEYDEMIKKLDIWLDEATISAELPWDLK